MAQEYITKKTEDTLWKLFGLYGTNFIYQHSMTGKKAQTVLRKQNTEIVKLFAKTLSSLRIK